MIFTQSGLPNSCFLCGKSLTRAEGWYAEHEDAARSGQGICADHMPEAPNAEPSDTAPETETEPIETNAPALDDSFESDADDDGDEIESEGDDTEDFVSPLDEDGDNKPEVITHKKRKAKRAKKAKAK